LIQSFFFAQIFEHKKTEPEFCFNYFFRLRTKYENGGSCSGCSASIIVSQSV